MHSSLSTKPTMRAFRSPVHPACSPSLSFCPSRFPAHLPTLSTPAKPARAVPIPVAQAAAAGIATSDGLLIRATTGVPLVEIFKSMTLMEAAAQSATLIGMVVVACFFGDRIIGFLGAKIEAALGRKENNSGSPLARLAGTVVGAAENPTRALLPWFGLTYVSTVLAAFAEVSMMRWVARDQGIKTLAGAWGKRVWVALQDFVQLMQDLSEVVVIFWAAWFVINLKDRLVKGIMANAAADPAIEEDTIARIVYPVSTLISWATVVLAGLTSFTAMGFNVQPLLAFGSVSTLAVGFAAQSTVANVVSAFSLYTSRPFIAGDRVQLKTMSGGLVVAGTVEKIMPMNTVIKTDAGMPVFVHNKDIASSLLIINESKLLRTPYTNAYPSLDTTITLRYQDVDKVAAIQDDCTAWLKAHPDVLPGATCKCAMTGFDLHGPIMEIKAILKRECSSRKSAVFRDMLLYVERCVRRNGAYLATKEYVALPPAVSATEENGSMELPA